MKNLITYLKALWSRVADSQSTDVSLGRRLTVGSPSGFGSKSLLKFVSVLALILTLGVGNVWGTDYNLVTNVSQLSAGDIVVISTSGGTTATTVENTNGKKDAYWYGYVASTGSVASGKLTALGTNTAEYTLSKSGSYWVLTCSSGYVGSVSTKKLRYNTGTSTWTIAVNTTNYQATISSTDDTGDIQFANGDRFRTYTSAQTAVYLFKKAAAAKTVSSISIKTAPTKTTYCAGESFDPTGLVITATYSDATTGDISYAEHSSDFSFSPATNASLTTLNTSVTVTYATKTANQSITVNTAYAIACDGSIANGSISANSTACAGEEVTLTASPNTHYHLGSWTITKHSDGTNVTASVLDGNTLTMPAYAVDVTATFAEDSYKTVVFKNNGGLLFDDGGSASTYDATNKWKQKVYVGDAPAMPTSLVDETDNCDANSTSFYGWTKTTWGDKIADKDALDDWIDEDDSHEVYTSDDDLATVAAGDPATIVYHAVWAEGSGSGGFQQITSLDDIQEGSAYFAYYGQYSSVNSWYGVNAIGTVVAPVDVSEGVITTSKTGDGAYSLLEFTIVESDAENREYYIKVGNKYVTGSTTNKAALTLGDDAYLWKFMSINSTTYNLEIKHVASTSCWIKVGVGSLTSGKFGSYTSSGNQVSMFQSTGTAYENFLTTCCEAPTAPTNGSITSSSQTVSWTAPSSGTPGDGYLVAYSKNYSTAPGDDVYETGDDEHFTVLTAATATASIPCNAEGTYYWWVRSKCSDSDFSSCSEWVEGDDWTMRAIYLNTNYEWYANNAKFAIHYWNDDTPTPVSGWSKFMTEESGCATGIYKGFVPEGYNNINFGRFNPAQSTDPTDWTNRWNQTSDLTIPTSPAKDYFTLSSKTGDNDYNGSWSNYAPYYTISFNNNAAFSTTSAPSSQCILEGAKASAPTDPLAMGKEVDGWYKEAGCDNEWVFTTQTVSANQTLYAHWADVATKTIYLDCSKELSGSKEWDDDNVVLFAHAYIDGTSIYTDVKVTSAINSCDAHVYAFEIPGNADYVTFARCATGATSIVWEGGSKNVYNQFSLAVEASKDWYKVTGWDAGSLESTAFAATTYTISFAANSGSGTMSEEEVECDNDYTIKTNTFTRDCYAFTGWKADVDVKISGATVSAGTLITAGSTIQDVESNITLTAQWSQYSCTVTLHKNGATTGTNQTVSATCGSSMPLETTSSVAIAVPSKTGYTFLGYWDTDASSGGNQYYSYDGSTLSSYTDWDKETNTAQTLYARWEANIDHFIDDMHKTTGYTGSGHSESGANYTMPGPLSDVASGNECETNHYIFVGWVVASGQDDDGTINGTSKIYRPGEKKSATNATYYAVWAEE